MRIDVVGRKIDITDTIREHAEAKAEKLQKHFNGVQQITMTVTHEVGIKDNPFDVEVLTDVVGHQDFVGHARGSDVYGAIERAVAKCDRQLMDFKDKLRVKR